MKILSIDSALDTFCVSVSEDDSVIFETVCIRPRAQLKCLAGAVDNAFSMSGVSKKDIGLVAVTKGPGSFTGIRLAETTAMTVAQILSVPVAPVCTLDAVYASLPDIGGRTAVAFDARKGEIFAAFYCNGERISEYEAFSPEGFAEYASSIGAERVTGNALAKYGDMIREALPSAFFYEKDFWYPRGRGMASLALKMHGAGESVSCYEVRPFYMRKPEAEEAREKRLAEGLEKNEL
ncbi:MAG: tRNA (adenosine(37)-N6)-threonylcarbamoyltransferase complex dimerization subunit type 1 TsaB [bacterium]|nr:tRNA (adenosine(37)-N6)-threonylcarbamoyltransferase complex dimerization subunit type 1 TsaB [bacterium]